MKAGKRQNNQTLLIFYTIQVVIFFYGAQI